MIVSPRVAPEWVICGYSRKSGSRGIFYSSVSRRLAASIIFAHLLGLDFALALFGAVWLRLQRVVALAVLG